MKVYNIYLQILYIGLQLLMATRELIYNVVTQLPILRLRITNGTT